MKKKKYFIQKHSRYLIYIACFSIMMLFAINVFYRFEELPSSIPMFQAPTGKIMKSAPKSILSVARLPLMHLIFLSIVVLLVENATKKLNQYNRLLFMAVLAITAKGVIELILLSYDVHSTGWASMAWAPLLPVLLFLGTLIHTLRQNGGKLDLSIFRIQGFFAFLLYGGLAMYVLLVLMPFWLP